MIPLATRAPFNLEATVRVLQRRPTNVVDMWENGRYRRLCELSGGLSLVEVHDRGTAANPRPRLRIVAGGDSDTAYAESRALVRRMLGLDVDPGPLRRRAESAAASRAICRALRGMRPPRFASLFEAFASVIPFQQLSLDAGTAIVARLVTRFGRHVVHEGRRFHAFPAAKRIALARLDSLRACGLSRPKALTLRGIARAIEAGELRESDLARLGTAEAMARLVELPGIGPWSAGLVMLRGLGRLDVFPPGDVGAARNLRNLMQLDPRAPLEPVIEGFGGCRGYLYFCALGGVLLRSGLIRPAA